MTAGKHNVVKHDVFHLNKIGEHMFKIRKLQKIYEAHRWFTKWI